MDVIQIFNIFISCSEGDNRPSTSYEIIRTENMYISFSIVNICGYCWHTKAKMRKIGVSEFQVV